MGFQLKPKDSKFFDFIMDITGTLKEAGSVLEASTKDPDQLEQYLEQIDDIESKADVINDKILSKLNSTFITPIDREDIFALSNKLDDVVDGIQGIIERMSLYHVGQATEGTAELVGILIKAIKQIDKACSYLHDIKNSRLKIEARCGRIIDLEYKGDRAYRQEMAKLFRECSDPIEIIKWKEILVELENLLDICEDIADIIKGVVLKYA